ncbi:MAG: methyltransferase domain-containing protein [Kofleriaceae bacterium]
MRAAAVIIVWAGCAHAPPAVDVKDLSHRVIDAFEHGRRAEVEPRLAPGFVHVEDGAPRDRTKDLEILAKWKPAAPHIVERTWSEESVLATGTEAVFVGRALEHDSGARGGRSYDGRYTLAWHFEDGAWRLALWTWSSHGAAAERDRWDDIFKHGTGYETQPNKLLVATVEKLAPGAALDIASGQGRNVLFLASKGWKATGIDFSHEGIEQTRATAKVRGLTVELLEQDVDTADLGTAKYDLVSMIYAGADLKQIAKAQAALKPGGMFVFEYFDASVGMDGAAAGVLAKLFAGYEILEDDIVDDVPDWALDRAKLQRFVAKKR